MSWNHRVIRSEDAAGDVCYALHECYYDNNGDTIPTMWTGPTDVSSETRAGLFWVLALMTEAVAQPVLEVKDGKLVEVEPMRQLTDDLQKAIGANKEFAEGMA